MSSDNVSEVGYRKPPKRTQFVKGQSGNPKGRPKGSQNLSTLLNKVGRQRIRVTENGLSRSLTKFEALILQLTNKAVQGDIKAANELRYWIQTWTDPTNDGPPSLATHKNDEAVMASAIERIRQSENTTWVETASSISEDEPQEEK